MHSKITARYQFSEAIKISICRPIDAVNDYSGQLVVTTTSKKNFYHQSDLQGYG